MNRNRISNIQVYTGGNTDNNSATPRSHTPTVSLVIPVHNAEPYLTDCLRSIAAQTFQDFEALIIDDSSTDDSRQIAAGFCSADNRFRLVPIPHSGVSRARNTGIDLARGEYLGFVDADDCMLPRALESMLDTIKSTGAEVCVGKFVRGVTWPLETTPVRSGRRNATVMSYNQAMEKALYQKIILNSPWGMLMKRQLLGKDVRFREGIRYEDLDAFYRFYEPADLIAYLHEPVYFYRQVSNSFIHRWRPERLDALDVTDRMVDYMAINHPSLIRAARDRRFSACYNMLLRLLHYGVDNEVAVKRCMAVIKSERLSTILSTRIRLKNRVGAVISYFGLPFLKLIARRMPVQ